MKNRIIFIVGLFTVCFFITSCGSSIEEKVQNARGKKYRSVVVVNYTNLDKLEEVTLYTSNGLIISSQKNIKDDNILFENFDAKKTYSDVNSYKIVFKGKKNIKYEKLFNTNEKGLTIVHMNESDCKTETFSTSTGGLLESVGSYFSSEIDHISSGIQNKIQEKQSERLNNKSE